MKTKVGSPGDDPERTRRYAIAYPSAIVITALLILISGLQPPERPAAERSEAATVVLERAAPTPRPTPKPTPPPTPPPVARVTLAPVQRVAPVLLAHHTAGGTHAARTLVPHLAPARTFAAPNGAGGSGTSAAAGTGDGSGSGDAAGAGSAAGGDSVNADAPCGVPELIPYDTPDHRGSTIYQHIKATVTFPDGHTETDNFPYPFVYANSDADPWSARNQRDPDFPTLVQQPPPSANVSRYPELIRYILDHTRKETGRTTLQDCPRRR